MLHNWLQPYAPDNTTPPAPYAFGQHIQQYRPKQAQLRAGSIALLGCHAAEADPIRKALYALSFPFQGLEFTDLGNARNPDPAFLAPIIRELLESEVTPIILGHIPTQATAQYAAYQELQYLINLLVVDEQVPYHPARLQEAQHYLQSLLDSPKSSLFHLSLLGTQAHFVAPEVFRYLDQKRFDYVRLGRAKANITELEPLIRDSDLLCFNLSALKQCEAPGQQAPSPNGFSSEEACQIARYAGMSDKLKSFGLYGFLNEQDLGRQTAQLCAQLIWYFVDGFYHRKGDFPTSMDGMSEYIVDFKGHEYQLTFWRSEKSNRWWMQVPVKTHHRLQRHRLVPCSYNDYLKACQDELPERLLNALDRFA